jgi:hypothetical protein
MHQLWIDLAAGEYLAGDAPGASGVATKGNSHTVGPAEI